MSTTTANLGLFKYTDEDLNVPFDFHAALNNNWDIIDEITNVSSRNIGEKVTSTIPLEDAGLHLLDGSLLSGNGIYKSFVDHMVELYNSSDEMKWSLPIYKINTYSGDCISLIYDGTKFIVLTTIGYISTSTDGTTWSAPHEVFDSQGFDWRTLAYNGSVYIALTYKGYISTSTDGTTWTTATQNANLGNNNWRHLIWDGTKFIALSYTGYISTSTDGTTWSAATQNANLGNNSWMDFVWDGTKFIALGYYGYISTSTDGVNWTEAIQDINLGENRWRSLTWDGTKFIALGYYSYISTSTDGINWTEATYNGGLSGERWCVLTYDGTKVVAVSEDGLVSLYSFDIVPAAPFCKGEVPWTQPVLTANGTLGGNSFAVYGSTYATDRAAYKSFDGNYATKWGTNNTNGGSLIFYNPDPLKVSSILYTFSSDHPEEDGGTLTVEGGSRNPSNGSYVWKVLWTGSYTAYNNKVMPINSPSFYKYYRIDISSPVSYYAGLGNLTINAVRQGTAEEEWQAEVTDYGACNKYVYDSANNTIRLPKGSSEHGPLIKSYHDGAVSANWYRIYADGWCEQGGFVSNEVYHGSVIINLLIPYIDDKYFPSVTHWGQYDTTVWGSHTNYVWNITPTSFETGVSSESSALYSVKWAAEGYINFSQSPFYEYITVGTSTRTDIEVDIDNITNDFQNITTQLNNKVDKTDLVEVPCIISTYNNGTSWYRIYSDNWCEQGGRYTISTAGSGTINFLIPFRNSNYAIFNCKTSADSSTWNVMFEPVTSWTRTYAIIKANLTGYQLGGSWMACGYI